MSYEVIGDAKILGQEKGSKITKNPLKNTAPILTL